MIFGWIHGRYINRIDPRLVVLDPVDMEMLGFIEQLPDDYLIAGHPADMDNVAVDREKIRSLRTRNSPCPTSPGTTES